MSWALLCGKLAAQHIHRPQDYFRALKPHARAIRDYTALALFFRGGGWRTRLMIRQLKLAPRAFQRIIARHDGKHHPLTLEPTALCQLLRPF